MGKKTELSIWLDGITIGVSPCVSPDPTSDPSDPNMGKIIHPGQHQPAI
jgi:hypothetical protein